MNLGAEPHGRTQTISGTLIGEGAVMLSPFTRRFMTRELLRLAVIAYRPRSCGLRLRIAHSCQSRRTGLLAQLEGYAVKAERTPLIP